MQRHGDPGAFENPSRPIAWPERDLSTPRELFEQTPERIFAYEAFDDDLEDELPEPVAARLASLVDPETQRPSHEVHHSMLTGRGLLRVYSDLERPNRPDPEAENSFRFLPSAEYIYGFLPNARFLTSLRTSSPEFAQRQDRASTQSRTFWVRHDNRMYRAIGVRRTALLERIALRQGMALHLPTEAPEDARGTLIHFTAMYGTSFERRVIDALRREGWLVLSVSTQSEIGSPVSEEATKRIDEIREDLETRILLEAAFLGQSRDEAHPDDEREKARELYASLVRDRRLLMDEAAQLSRGFYRLCDESDVDGVAAAMAHRVDDRLAEHAYAAEAALDYAMERFSFLRGRPVAVIGFSAGAMPAVTASAYLRERVDAVVLIGGGANIAEIAINSSLTHGGVRFGCDDETPTQRSLFGRVTSRYLEHSALDPHHTAPLLRDKPVLVVRATRDTWVPAETGRLLQKRLGEPSSLIHSGGHRTLFFFLPRHADRITRWLERATG
ncbi:MAG: alpha/beta hydrolase [Phycisphaerales bacterium]|nr:alpha/beta hydrolase [Phycisphaerales bacterium]